MNRIWKLKGSAALFAGILLIAATASAEDSSHTAVPSVSSKPSVLGTLHDAGISALTTAIRKEASRNEMPAEGIKGSLLWPNPAFRNPARDVLGLPWLTRLTAPHIVVVGGINPNGYNTPGLFTWHTNVPVEGSGWDAGETVNVFIHGPLNSVGATPNTRFIRSFVADGSGAFSGAFTVPYDEDGPRTMPQPGYYEVRAGAPSGFEANPPHISICPATYLLDGVGIDWGYLRGGRTGGAGDIKRVFPHWMHVWDAKPQGIYGECSYTDTDGNNMPSFMRHSEYPGDHYAHDFNIMLVPDEAYRWCVGTANYYHIEPSDPQPNREFGRIEIEHEMLNNGSPYGYGLGNIGMPLFVLPTPGDRNYIVGNWALDAGHPEKGDRTEIHPPRLLVTMRKRPTVTQLVNGPSGCMTYASQVDIYLSPHFGGGGRLFHSLSDVLDTPSGGGRIRDVMSDTTDYYSGDIGTSTGLNSGPFPAAGGYERLPESQPINNMDYEFDVPLPSPPSGASSPHATVAYRDLHGTSVVEQISYTNEVNGLPTVAHIKIPANGGDNGIYSATIKFSWNKYKAPAKHFQIRLQNILIVDDSDDCLLNTGEWYMWADVAGKWINLRHLDSEAFQDADDDDEIDLTNSGAVDVYVNPGDPLYVAGFGYEQDCLDTLFGEGFDWDSAEAVINLALCLPDFCEPLDNDDLAGAIFKFDGPTSTNAPGLYDIPAARAVLNDDVSHYNLRFKIDYVPSAPRIEINAMPGNFGNVCIGECEDRVVEIYNIGEEELEVNQITLTGAGYSLLGPNLPFIVQGGEHVNVTVRFCPTAPGQGDGTIKFESNDNCQPSLTFDLRATAVFPIASLSGSLAYGLVPVDDRSVGFFATRVFQINNTGPCPLQVTSVGITSGAADGFFVSAPPSFPQSIQPGGSLEVPVRFNPVAEGLVFGTVSVTVANDPTHPTPLTIFCTGNGIVPTVSSTPAHTIFEPTVVNCSRSQLVTVFNTGPAELIVDSATVTGTGYSLSPVALPIRLAPNASTNLSVTFTPPSIARAFNGTLTLATNDPLHPTITNTFCGEGAPTGIRVIVLKADGTPYGRVDQITVASHGVTPNTNTARRDVTLTSVLPPDSCLPIQYHIEMALPPTLTFGTRGSYYNVKAKVGNKQQSVSFSLPFCTFKTVVIRLQ